MIIKSFEINKIDPFKNNLILFYGQNEGLKDENILKLSSKFHNIIKYHEREVLENQDNFFESIFSGSLFDEDKFIIEYCKAVIKGWSGLKYRYLEELLLVDISNLDAEDELPYTQDNAELLMKNSNTFDTWVTEAVGDLENFTGNKSPE